MHIFTRAMQCCSVVLAMALSVRVSVCYKSVLCPNAELIKLLFGTEATVGNRQIASHCGLLALPA